MAKLILNGATSGSITLESPSVSGSNTLTLPANTGTVITTGSTFGGTGPAFRAYQSTAQSALSAGVETKILLQTEDWDTNSNFASSRFTPTVAGYYQINATTQINGSTTFLYVAIYKNGTAYRYGSYIPYTSNNPISTVSDIVYCNGSTDYIEMYAASGSSQAPTATSSGTSMSGSLIRGA
jgi:hypothetical protein